MFFKLLSCGLHANTEKCIYFVVERLSCRNERAMDWHALNLTRRWKSLDRTPFSPDKCSPIVEYTQRRSKSQLEWLLRAFSPAPSRQENLEEEEEASHYLVVILYTKISCVLNKAWGLSLYLSRLANDVNDKYFGTHLSHDLDEQSSYLRRMNHQHRSCRRFPAVSSPGILEYSCRLESRFRAMNGEEVNVQTARTVGSAPCVMTTTRGRWAFFFGSSLRALAISFTSSLWKWEISCGEISTGWSLTASFNWCLPKARASWRKGDLISNGFTLRTNRFVAKEIINIGHRLHQSIAEEFADERSG